MFTRAAIVAAILGAAAACGGGGDGGGGPSPSQVIGSWNVTKLLFVSQANPQQSVDRIAQGATAVMVIDANNGFTLTITPTTGPQEIQTGTWSLSGQIFTVTPTGMPFNWQFNIASTGTTIRLSGADVDFDVNNDGTDEPAKLTIEAAK
jgi:hypothetical protein